MRRKIDLNELPNNTLTRFETKLSVKARKELRKLAKFFNISNESDLASHILTWGIYQTKKSKTLTFEK